MHAFAKIYLDRKASLGEMFFATGDVAGYLKEHTRALEMALASLRESCKLDERIALLATGGFARGELFAYSDIDIELLTPETLDEGEKAKLSKFVTTLWDLGLTVGASVRSTQETLQAAACDVSVATNFLESRLLSGNALLYEETRRRFLTSLDVKAFFRDKVLEMQQRHKKHADTPYELEPDVKESLGGLRDIQVPLWCARAAGWGSTPDALVRNGLITKHEAFALLEAMQFLSQVRLRLQLMSGRHENRLVFDKQNILAESMGIQAERQLDRAETLMQHYYRNAKKVVLLNGIAMRSLEERLFQASHKATGENILGNGFLAQGSTLDIEDEGLFHKHPENLVECFYQFAQHRELKDFSVRLMRSLYRDAPLADGTFLKSAANKALFLKILKLHYGCYTSFKNMNRWGILGGIIPQFDHIVGQMQHDLFHAYTVDQHTLKTIKYIRRFAHSTYAHEFPLLSELMATCEKPWLLTLAALFHDIGKGQGGRHEVLGATAVEAFAKDLGLTSEETAFVRFLVLEHLTMSAVAQKEDISDPEVILRFSRRVGKIDYLNGLYLLTHADIRATSPKIWNGWKAQLLEELYLKAKAVLAGEDATLIGDSVLEEKKQSVLALLVHESMTPESVLRFFDERDLTYFLRNTPEDIAWHASLVARDLRPKRPIIEMRQASELLLKLFVYLPDQKELFSRLVCAFERTGLSVLDARVHTSRSGWALDTFLVEDKRSHPDFPGFAKSFSEQLAEDFLLQRPLPQTKTGRLSRRSRTFPVKPLVDIDEDASGKGALLKVTCSDRLGLLYAISLCLSRHGINLVSAKIATLDERVEDVFLIDGEALKVPENVLALESELLRVVSDVK